MKSLMILQMATIQDALTTLCPNGPIKSEYPLSMEAISQVCVEGIYQDSNFLSLKMFTIVTEKYLFVLFYIENFDQSWQPSGCL